MTRPFTAVILAIVATSLSMPVFAQQAVSTEAGIDYEGFVELAGDLGDYRSTRLLSWEDWQAAASAPGTVILDTRSSAAFEAGHIRGAVNLPFSEFTDEKLAEILPSSDVAIFIYCNNNFADDRPPVPLKRAPLALNIPTFINLVGYGYDNVWELGEVVDLASVDWVSNP